MNKCIYYLATQDYLDVIAEYFCCMLFNEGILSGKEVMKLRVCLHLILPTVAQ